MITNFDYFNQPELPYLILCNPDGSELSSLGLFYEDKLSIRYNAISEFTFLFPKSIDGGITVLDEYDQIKNKKLVLLENYGYFIIDNAIEEMDGGQPFKRVSCKSWEYDLVSKRVTGYGGTVKLYDSISPSGTLLYTILQLAPNWTVGTIDPVLMTKYRTFEITDTTIYNMLVSEVSSAFECVFVFDNVNRTVSALDYENATTETDIFLSFDNLIDKATLSEKTDEITTCLAVYGGGDLNIRAVNPLGTDKIYDFSYFATTEWMDSALILAITNWQNLISSNQTAYADLLTLLNTYQAELIVLNSDLSELNAELLALEGVQKVRIENGDSYSDINAQIEAKEEEIANQQILVDNKQVQIDSTIADLQVIHDLVSFENNFSSWQLLQLNNFIYENTYKNENIIQTDNMTAVEIQEKELSLYTQSQTVLGRVSQPRYEINFDAVNYIDLPEFEVFTNQTELGSLVTVELSEGQAVESVLLEINLSFHNPTDFSLSFSNRLRLDNGDFVYSDLFGAVVKTGAKVTFDNLKWSNWENDYKDDVTNFITSALDTTTNNLINNSNQEILINQNGLRGRTFNTTTGQYDPTQVWLTSSVLAFTDDSFQTSKLALGKVSVNGTDQFGLVGDVIVGRLLAGNALTITNEGANFTLDSSGATLVNAKFSIQSTNTKITIDPTLTESFVIQKNVGGTWTNKFWVDNAGNVNFSGVLSGATGTFTGSITAATGFIGTLVIDANGLKTSNGLNYLRGNGDLKWGGLSITSGSATFTGNVYADKLVGEVSYSQLTDIPFDKVVTGTAASDTILRWPGNVKVYSGGYGISSIEAPRIELASTQGDGSFIFLDDSTLTFGADTAVIFSSESGRAEFNGRVYTNSPSGFISGYGQNVTVTVTTPSGTRYLRFDNGILVQYATS